jgi:hypothetical protein
MRVMVMNWRLQILTLWSFQVRNFFSRLLYDPFAWIYFWSRLPVKHLLRSTAPPLFPQLREEADDIRPTPWMAYAWSLHYCAYCFECTHPYMCVHYSTYTWDIVSQQVCKFPNSWSASLMDPFHAMLNCYFTGGVPSPLWPSVWHSAADTGVGVPLQTGGAAACTRPHAGTEENISALKDWRNMA